MGRVFAALRNIWKGPDPSQLQISRDRHGNFGHMGSIGVGLNSWEIRYLKKNWLQLRAQKQIGLQCFAVLFEKHPDAKGVFGMKNASLETALDDYRVKSQALIIEDTIEMVIMDLCADNDGLRWPLVHLGEQHYHFGANRGIKHEYLLTFGVAFLETVARQPTTGMRRLKRWKMLRMWRRFTYFLMTCLLTGYHLGMDGAPNYVKPNASTKVKNKPPGDTAAARQQPKIKIDQIESSDNANEPDAAEKAPDKQNAPSGSSLTVANGGSTNMLNQKQSMDAFALPPSSRGSPNSLTPSPKHSRRTNRNCSSFSEQPQPGTMHRKHALRITPTPSTQSLSTIVVSGRTYSHVEMTLMAAIARLPVKM